VERKLTAILCADVHGYSRLMAANEEPTLRTLSSYRKLIDSLIEQHRGRFVNSAGDSVLAEFPSIVNAVQCAVEIQTALKAENAPLEPDRRMQFRIGVNLGDVMVEGEQIYGDGVNIAARLESLADPGGICISGTVQEQIRDKLTLGYQDLGEQTVKNIPRPVRVFRLTTEPGTARRVLRVRPKYVRRGAFSAIGITIVAAIFLAVQHLSLRPPTTSASIPLEDKAPPLPDIPSIAVLPFTNMSGDREQEYLSDGITDDLTIALAKSPDLFVIGTPSAFSYKGKTWKAGDVGRELGVKYLLAGGVRRSDSQVRVTAHLLDAASGRELWVAEYDRPLSGRFDMQDELVQRIAKTLNIRVQMEQIAEPAGWTREIAAAPPHGMGAASSEAYDDFLLGMMSLSSNTKEGIAKGRELEEKAVALDPNYGLAYFALGSTYIQDIAQGWSRDGDLERASEMAQKAIAVADSNLCASCAYGLASLVALFKLQRDQAIQYSERAVELDSNIPYPYLTLAIALITVGRTEEGLDAVQKAMRHDPRNPEPYLGAVAAAYLAQGRYPDAIAVLKRYLDRSPNEIGPHLELAIAYTELGQHEAARAEVAKILRINPQFGLRRTIPLFKDRALNERWDSDLKQAGLA
jgi:TolB-like protein/class 3 adenylate cyclase/Tfp pilus assembly protein PilF